jgi:hypothetical protein
MRLSSARVSLRSLRGVVLFLLMLFAVLHRPQPLRAQAQQPHPLWDAKGI